MKLGSLDVENLMLGSVEVEKVYFGNDLVYENKVPYLEFSSPSTFTLKTANGNANWDGTLEYATASPDLAMSWQTWNGTQINSSNSGKLYLRGVGNTKITGLVDGTLGSAGKFVLTGSNISCNGNIENLLDYPTVSNNNHPVMANRGFSYLFSGNTSLIKAPKLLSTTLEPYCYASMFYNCSNLIMPPSILPATSLEEGCYASMFKSCTSLTTAPVLSATNLAIYCYQYMFQGCTSLTTPPRLIATTLAGGCYQSMFAGCTGLTSLPALIATTLVSDCYYAMLHSCISIKISATQTGEYQTPYRIPATGTGVDDVNTMDGMFIGTGGTFTDTPTINTTYYTSNSIVV